MSLSLRKSGMEEVMGREEALQVSQRMLRSMFTPIITIYGEARVKLGDKVYTVKAPEGVTIREEYGHESLS